MDAIEGLENGLTILLVAYRISTVQRSGKHGRPLALYSDHHSIFPKHETGDQTPTQFELALGELNIDSILLNSTLPSTFSVIGETWLNEINELRWFLC